MTQRHVVPADIARGLFEDAFHGGDKSNAMTPTGSKWITWLVGPIACFQCNGTRKNISTPPGAGPFLIDCPDCNGLGYPPAVEIVSEMEVHPGNEPYAVVHGVVKLGKPVPIVGTCGKVPTDIECIITIAGQADRVWHSRPPNDFANPIADTNPIADNIGPCEPGQVAYPVEVVS